MKISDMSYVVVEGPIGVGKTTLANKLALEWDAELLLEKVENNPFLEKFYDNPEQLALATQLYFLLIRSRQIHAINQQSIFSNIRVSDFMPQKDRLFAQNNLTKDELDLYEQIYAYLTSSLPSPDLVIYLQAPTSILINRIKKRNRIFEKSMDIEYLEKLNNSYASFFHSYKNSTLLVVNTENIDLLNNDNDYKTLLKKISKIEDGIHYLNPMGSIA